MKGRSYRELDVLFERKISARDFKETVVGENEGDHTPAQVTTDEKERRSSQAVQLAQI
jgi:SP family general alpha glucoside:H+ symporter-like MFS transporter